MKNYSSINLSILEVALFFSAITTCCLILAFGFQTIEAFWQTVGLSTLQELEQRITQVNSFQ